MEQEVFTTINPATNLPLATYPIYSTQKIRTACLNAEKAFKAWRTTSMKERSLLLQRIASIILQDINNYAALASQEMGKPLVQSIAELEKCAMTLEYYALNGPHFLQDQTVETAMRKSYVSYQPLGVVLAIMPWNYPYWQVFRALGPILISGNAMLLKHAANVSGTAITIEKILKRAQAPKHLFQSLIVANNDVEALIAAPEVKALTFTGSTQVGRILAATAAKYLKKQVLELGGSDAYIICEDAALDQAVDACYEARFVNSGQSCVAAKRLIVHKNIRKEFEARLKAKIENTCYGDPFDPLSKIGPMARIDLRDQLHKQVIASIEAGAQLCCGAYIPKQEGAFYPPTLLTKVKKGMPAYHEELFGPVAVIIEAKDEAQAIRIANDTEYGLGAAVFSKDKKRAEQIARNVLEAGSCFVNASVHSDPRLPFGGIKNSGYGRELSYFALHEFVNIKTVAIK